MLIVIIIIIYARTIYKNAVVLVGKGTQRLYLRKVSAGAAFTGFDVTVTGTRSVYHAWKKTGVRRGAATRGTVSSSERNRLPLGSRARGLRLYLNPSTVCFSLGITVYLILVATQSCRGTARGTIPRPGLQSRTRVYSLFPASYTRVSLLRLQDR